MVPPAVKMSLTPTIGRMLAGMLLVLGGAAFPASAAAPKMNDGETVADAAVAANPAMQPIQDVPGLPRVLLIGDSISIGYTLPVRELLRGKANVHRIPNNGASTTYGLQRLESWLGPGKWDVIHFNFGLHDAKLPPEGVRHTPRETYEENLRSIVARLKQTGARLIWAATTPVPNGGVLSPTRRFDDIAERNRIAARVMNAGGVPVNDLHAVILPRLAELQRANDVHFSAGGSALLAETVARSISAQLPVTGSRSAKAPPATPSPRNLPDLQIVAADLVVPESQVAAPTPGIRVFSTTSGWEGTAVRHTIYLPRDWRPGKKYPILVEYAGNGGYRNAFGDVSDGTPEGCRLGYGISGGEGFLWICLPFVEVKDGRKQNAVRWWGDVSETKRYCLATVRDVCARFGGDERAIVFCGFSRGAIAANYLGLHDDEIAGLWRAFICHSHYDGVRETWGYPGADRASALVRLRRLGGRAQFISHEGGTGPVEAWLNSTGVEGRWTFVPIPFRNHSADWVLRDLPERRRLREWLAAVLAE